MTALFDRPLRRDLVLRVWCGVMVVLGLVALDGNTTWNGSLEADRVAGFLGDLLWMLLLSFLVLALLPAWLRRESRRATPSGTTPSADQEHPRDLEVDEAGDAGAVDSVGPVEAPVAASGAPRFLDLRVNGNPAAPGLTTRITWATSDATSVTVDGRSGSAPNGSYEVQLTEAREIALVAHGASGATQSRTIRVGFLSLPQLTKVSLPAGPGFTLRTSVNLLSGADAPGLRTVDAVLQGHDLTRSALAPPSAGLSTGTDLASLARLALDVRWMRRSPQHPHPDRPHAPGRSESQA